MYVRDFLSVIVQSKKIVKQIVIIFTVMHIVNMPVVF